jgi:hypothetical protein
LGRKVIPKLHEATADADGRFSITVDKSPYDQLPTLEPMWQTYSKYTPVVAVLKGFGPAHIETGEIEDGKPVTMKLVEDQPIRGQIIDLEGQPVRGMRVTIEEVQMLENDDPTPMLNGLSSQAGEQVFILAPHFQRQWGLRLVERRLTDLPETVVTDENGFLEVQGLGKDRVIHFALNGGEVAWRTIKAMSREMEPVQPASRMPPPRVRMADRPAAGELLYGSNFQVAVPPSRPITGIVIDAQTKKPIAGASIEMERPGSNRMWRSMALHTGRPLTIMKATSDEAGRFRLMGMAKAGGNRVSAFPPDNEPYFHREIDVRDPAGVDPIDLTIELHRGIWIKGRITEKGTNEPIVGAPVHYYPFRSNEFAPGIPTFGPQGRREMDFDRFKTGLNGEYRLIGLPGPGIVAAESKFRPYRTGVGIDQLSLFKDGRTSRPLIYYPVPFMRLDDHNILHEINLAADEQEARVNLEFDPGDSVTVLLVDSEGVPVKDVRVVGSSIRASASSEEDLHHGMVTIGNLGPGDKPVIQAFNFERNLGLKIQLEPPYEKGREVTFVLEPLAIATGRLFEDGQPLSRVVIVRNHYLEPDRIVSQFIRPPVVTDQEGRFRGPLIPGYDYQLIAQGRSLPPQVRISEKFTVKSGETVDLGDLEFEQGESDFRARFRPLKSKPEQQEPKND